MATPVSDVSSPSLAFMASMQASFDILAARKAARQVFTGPAVSAPLPALSPFRMEPNGRTYESLMAEDRARRADRQARLAEGVTAYIRERLCMPEERGSSL
jgi:hypothetical protein